VYLGLTIEVFNNDHNQLLCRRELNVLNTGKFLVFIPGTVPLPVSVYKIFIASMQLRQVISWL
jgi:hypothetical protein